MTTCPVCNSTGAVDTVDRSRLPAMQNYVYRTREQALAAACGRFVLAVCRGCGFAWNRAFDPARVVYDEGYDNAVPSAIMQAYYAEIVDFLVDKYPLEDGQIVDVGCGDGRFLRLICAAVPGSRGLGIDPALERSGIEADGRLVFVKDVFSAAAIREPPSLVVSRHVLEHMPQPIEFLRAIGTSLDEFGPRPCFFEVPDLDWSVEHGAFWDFCYEHCSYFTKESFAEALRRAGLTPTDANNAFGSQYLWLEAVSGPSHVHAPNHGAGSDLAERMLGYAVAESRRILATRARLADLRREGAAIAVWGMATKGVLFSILVDPTVSVIDYCVDANANKQGCFVPLTGHRISGPSELRDRAGDRPLTVVVMNDNYRDEIESTCRTLGIEASFERIDGAAADLVVRP